MHDLDRPIGFNILVYTINAIVPSFSRQVGVTEKVAAFRDESHRVTCQRQFNLRASHKSELRDTIYGKARIIEKPILYPQGLRCMLGVQSGSGETPSLIGVPVCPLVPPALSLLSRTLTRTTPKPSPRRNSFGLKIVVPFWSRTVGSDWIDGTIAMQWHCHSRRKPVLAFLTTSIYPRGKLRPL